MPVAYFVKETFGAGLAATSGPGPSKVSKLEPVEAARPGQRISPDLDGDRQRRWLDLDMDRQRRWLPPMRYRIPYH